MIYKKAFPYQFSVLNYAKSERFDAWRAGHKHYDIAQQMRAVDIHNAHFQGAHLNELMLGRWHLRASHIDNVKRLARRSSLKLRQDNLDHYYFRLSLSDTWIYQLDDKPITVKPGQLVLLDLGQPFDLSIATGDVLMLVVPRDYLPINTASLHGSMLDHTLGKLFAEHIQALFQNISYLTSNEVSSVAEATISFLKAVLSSMPNQVIQAQRPINAGLFNKVRWYIDRHIDNADMRVHDICSQVGLSRSHLYRLFEPLGGVARYIRERRLAKVQVALQANASSRPLIADLAFRYGFSSPAQLSRTFKRKFGYTPSETAERALDIGINQKDFGADQWLLPR
ncbi:MAG: AraC family transcriptional regulator [Gammaproteobacteria bacterium]|nr:AraC family transcriptional regulator [Gammaproteobacteria bacterium]